MKSIPATQNDPVEKHPESIDFPGFEQLRLTADTKQQSLRMLNPAGNVCYFKISIILEDGTLLWQSDFVEPGYYSEAVTLTQPLTAGKYEHASVLYEAFSFDESRTPLNSGCIEVFLNVS